MDVKGWAHERLKIMTLQALAHQAHGEKEAAVQQLSEALALAEPGGFIRLFLDEGPPMAALLHEVSKHSVVPEYVRRLQTAFGKVGGRTSSTEYLAEPLSDRELEVLRLLATDLNGPEIARELMVSLSTFRTHTRNIYSKLAVNNRRAAVHRADDLNLL
jgi:LuxR family maltose regulon positive regulatory protein